MKTKILMVCLGNICRSPLAEGILQSKVNPNFVVVDSAGTGNYHIGSRPDPRSIAVAFKNGIDISQQRCRQFHKDDFNSFDHIYVMDESNYKNVIAKAQNEADKKKVKLILDQVSIDTKEVPDPYYDKAEGFDTVYRLLDNACTIIAQELKN